MILLVLERAAREDSPGHPILRILEAMRVVQVFVAERLRRFKEIGVCLLLFANDILQRAVFPTRFKHHLDETNKLCYTAS